MKPMLGGSLAEVGWKDDPIVQKTQHATTSSRISDDPVDPMPVRTAIVSQNNFSAQQ